MTYTRIVIIVGALIMITGIAVAAVMRVTAPPVAASNADTARARPGSADFSAVGAQTIEAAIKELDLIHAPLQTVAKDFTVKMTDGARFRLSEHRGSVVFINFWATWCPPCREEMPAMQRLFERSKDDGLVMLAVSIDADPKVVTPFLQEQRFTFAVGLDPKMELASTFGVRALPASFIVDRQGHLVASALGPRAWDSAASKALVKGLSR